DDLLFDAGLVGRSFGVGVVGQVEGGVDRVVGVVDGDRVVAKGDVVVTFGFGGSGFGGRLVDRPGSGFGIRKQFFVHFNCRTTSPRARRTASPGRRHRRCR